jgi:hypothetical protein
MAPILPLKGVTGFGTAFETYDTPKKIGQPKNYKVGLQL